MDGEKVQVTFSSSSFTDMGINPDSHTQSTLFAFLSSPSPLFDSLYGSVCVFTFPFIPERQRGLLSHLSGEKEKNKTEHASDRRRS